MSSSLNKIGAAGVELRAATAADAETIAALHADSWRRHYRGAYSDTFLDGDVVADRLEVWSARLAARGRMTTSGRSATILAEHSGRLVGFVHVRFDEDPRWGSLVDNLHVAGDRHRTGIGTRLLRRGADAAARQAGHTGLYLWVLQQNAAAQRFYLACGATPGEVALAAPPRGNRELLSGAPRTVRMSWSEAADLARLA